MSADQVSAIADSITAGATVIAVVIAAIAGYVAGKVLDLEQDRDHRRDDERRSAQADKVAAWLNQADVQAPDGRFMRAWGAILYNGSELPVYGAVVSCVHPTMGEANQRLDVVPPSNERDPFSYVTFSELSQQLGEPYLGEQWDIENRNDIAVSISFRDAGRRRWTRFADGNLRTLDLPPRPDGRLLRRLTRRSNL